MAFTCLGGRDKMHSRLHQFYIECDPYEKSLENLVLPTSFFRIEHPFEKSQAKTKLHAPLCHIYFELSKTFNNFQHY